MNSEVVNPIDEVISSKSPTHFSTLADEWRAAREGCAVFPAWHRAIASATGEDTESFLHGMLTSDVRGLVPGTGQPSVFLTDTGKVVSGLRVHRGRDGFDLDCLSWRLGHLCAGLDKYIVADDVEIESREDRVPLVCLEGPTSGAVAGTVFGLPDLAPFGSAVATSNGADCTVRAVSDIGGTGFLVVGPPAQRDNIIAACAEAGAVPASLATLDVLRVEAGIAWSGVDMSEDTLLMEIGLPETISRSKGCYLGQEVVERVSARGQVNRTLTAFKIEARLGDLPSYALDVRNGSGATVGRITSRVDSPAVGGLLGLGLLHRKGRESSSLEVVVGGSPYPCRVIEFPGAAAA